VTKYVTGNSRPLHSVILLGRQRRLLASEKCLSKRRRIGWNARMRDQKFAREFDERRMMENTFPASQLRISTRGWLMTAIFRGHVRRLLVSIPSPSCVTHLSLLVFFNPFSCFFFRSTLSHTGDRFARARGVPRRVSINSIPRCCVLQQRMGECHCEICVPYGMFVYYRALKTS